MCACVSYVPLFLGTSDEREQDDALVPPLVFIHRVHLHAAERRGLQQARDALQLLPVGGDDAHLAGFTAGLKKRTNKLVNCPGNNLC